MLKTSRSRITYTRQYCFINIRRRWVFLHADLKYDYWSKFSFSVADSINNIQSDERAVTLYWLHIDESVSLLLLGRHVTKGSSGITSFLIQLTYSATCYVRRWEVISMRWHGHLAVLLHKYKTWLHYAMMHWNIKVMK